MPKYEELNPKLIQKMAAVTITSKLNHEPISHKFAFTY
jgi:hypothetical protein